MLQSIRDRSEGWLAGTIIFLVIATFALWGVHSYLTENGAAPDNVASVNGVKISQITLATAYERLRQQQQQQMGADFVPDAKMELQLKKQALSQLVLTQVLAQAAAKEGYRITLGEVEGALLAMPAFQVNGRFSRERFNEVLGSTLYNEKAFLNDLQTSMLINQVRGGFVASAFALPTEIMTAVKYINQRRDLAYALIPVKNYLKAIAPDRDAVAAYYAQHRALFTMPEQVSLDYLTLSVPQIAATLKFTDAQLQQFYHANIGNYTAPQRWRIAHILLQVEPGAGAAQETTAKASSQALANRLQSGENFARLASRYSDDKLTATRGGMLDWFSSGMIDPAIETAVLTLKTPNSVAGPVKTKYGYELIKLIATEKPRAQSFEAVRAGVRKALAQQQAAQIFAEASDKLASLTYANPATLTVAAKELGLTIQTSALFDKNGGKEELTANPKIVAAAFSPLVLQGNNSDVIELSPDTLVVVRVKQHTPAHLKPQASVQTEIERVLQIKAAQQRAKTAGEQFASQLNDGARAVELAARAQVNWQTLKGINRYNTQAPAAVINDAFQLPRPATDAAGSAVNFQLPNGDYAVVQVVAVHDGALATTETDPQQRIYREELENTNGQLDYAIYVKEQLKKAKIVVTNKELATITDKLS